MPPSLETLSPLTSKSTVLSYCLDHPLKSIATCYTLSSIPDTSPKSSRTLLLLGGISLCQETWVPIIKSLYQLTSSSSDLSIHSVWTLERPNHGDASILNEESLKKNYPVSFPSRQYGAAIRTFLNSDILSEHERSNLAVVAHSGAVAATIHALHPLPSEMLIKDFVLVESPYCGYPAKPYLDALYKMVKKSNERKKTSWASLDEAMVWMKTHDPWRTFHPDVLQIILETYFRPDPSDPSRLTTKTMLEQVTACFNSDGYNLMTFYHMRKMFHLVRTHLIFGELHNLWPEELYRQIDANIEEDRPKVASVTIMKNAGHYVRIF